MDTICSDTLFDIFNYLNIYQILSYLTSNKCNYNITHQRYFTEYIICKRIGYKIQNEEILKTAYIYESNYYDTWRESILKWAKPTIIHKYFNNLNILGSLSNNDLFKLLTVIHPNPKVSPFLFSNKYILSKRAISLNYNSPDIMGLFGMEGVSFSHGIKYCFKYDREDVLQECFKIMIGKGTVGKSYLGISCKSNVSNYLTHTKDLKADDILRKLSLYSGMDILEYSITPELLIYSPKPLVLFNKYKETFLNNKDFNDGYNGNIYDCIDNYIGYIISHTLGCIYSPHKLHLDITNFNFMVFCYRLGYKDCIQYPTVKRKGILKVLSDEQLFIALDIITESMNVEDRNIFYNDIINTDKRGRLWDILFVLHRLRKYGEGLDDLRKLLWWNIKNTN